MKKIFKKTIILILFLNSFITFSQEMVNPIPLELKSNRDVFQIVNDSTKEVLFFISDRKNVQVLLLDNKMQIINSVTKERPDTKYNNIIGFSGEKSKPKLYWSDTDYKEICSQFYDIKNHTIASQDYKLELKNEKFLQDFSENKKFYILTVIKDSNFLKLYVFDADGKSETKIIDFSTFQLFKPNDEIGNIFEIFKILSEKDPESFIPFKNVLNLQKISTESPTSLTQSSEKIKCYSNENEIIITLDNTIYSTQLISIDLKTYKPILKDFQKAIIENSEKETKNSNSFLFEKKLFQIVLSSSKMIVTITDLDKGLIKEFSAIETEPISFKNSEILRKSGLTGSLRILDETSQLLRKINNKHCGISCYNLKGNLMMTIGSVSDEKNHGNGFSSTWSTGSGIGAPSYNTGYIGGSINTTYAKYKSYTNRKVVYIDCLFDKEMNPIKEKINPLAFDKIKKFSDGYYELPSETIYKLDGIYFLGFYHTKKNEYQLRKFED